MLTQLPANAQLLARLALQLHLAVAKLCGTDLGPGCGEHQVSTIV